MTDKCDRGDQVRRLLAKIKVTDSLAEAMAMASAAEKLIAKHELFQDGSNGFASSSTNVDVQLQLLETTTRLLNTQTQCSILTQKLEDSNRERRAQQRQLSEYWNLNADLKRENQELKEQLIESPSDSGRAERAGLGLYELFEREGAQGGADAIAKKLHVRADFARSLLKDMVADGYIEMVGPKNRRSYRKVTSSESGRAKQARSSQAGRAQSRSSETGRARAA
jgi:hypothetical protein